MTDASFQFPDIVLKGVDEAVSIIVNQCNINKRLNSLFCRSKEESQSFKNGIRFRPSPRLWKTGVPYTISGYDG